MAGGGEDLLGEGRISYKPPYKPSRKPSYKPFCKPSYKPSCKTSCALPRKPVKEGRGRKCPSEERLIKRPVRRAQRRPVVSGGERETYYP